MNLLSRLDFSALFPEEEKHDLAFYLNDVSQNRLIKALVLLAEVSDKDSSWQDWGVLIYEKWFQAANVEFANFIYSQIKRFEIEIRRKVENPNIILLNELATLKFAEYVLSRDVQPESDSIDILEAEINIFKALLIINEELNKTDDTAINSTKLANSVDDIPNLTYFNITFGMAQYEIVNANQFKLLYIYTTQLIKSVFLFDFLSENNKVLLNKFLLINKCPDFVEYLQRVMPIIISVFNNLPRKPNAVYDPKPTIISVDVQEYEEAIGFIENLLITPGIISEDIDFRYLRASPLVKYGENEYAIINKMFTIQKLYNSLYFVLKDINDSLTDEKIGDFRGYFTFNFTEKYLFYNVINNIYGNRPYIQFSGDDIDNDWNFEGGPDYYIRNGNKIFLFENKDIFINAEDKASYDFVKIKKAIDKKLVNTSGIPQIINNLRFCLTMNYPFDQEYDNEKCKIYPILIIHRSEFDTPGLNKYIQERFTEKLELLKQEGIDISNVFPITIINIDTLLFYQNAFAKKSIILEDAIKEYHSSVNVKKIRARNRVEYDRKLSKTFNSFTDFIWQGYAEDKGIIFKNQVKWWHDKYVKKRLF